MKSGTQKTQQEEELFLKQEPEEVIRFSSEEETSLLEESNTKKANANALFTKTKYEDAIDIYTDALSTCPNYLDYEVAVLKSNVAACYLKLQNWKEATKSATSALERLQKLEDNSNRKKEKQENVKYSDEEEADETIISAGAAMAHDTSDLKKRETDIQKIKIKALMRRAKANCELGSWSSLQSAQEDYNSLLQISSLSPADRRSIQQQLVSLPSRTKAAQDEEISNLMGQLKNIGNGILKPFGLSTDNFQVQKDDKTGSYSMNFNQNSPGS